MNKTVTWFGGVAVGIAIVGAWQLLANAGVISPVFFPGPDRSFGVLWEQLHDPEFWVTFRETLRRMALGFVSATVAGVAVGGAIGMSQKLRDYVVPTLELIRPLPASAIIPVFILLFGMNDTMVVAVIAFAAIWPIMLATIHGFRTVDVRLFEVSRLLGMSYFEVVRKIAIPSAMPDILAGARLALTVSLILAVVAEMLSGLIGLGHNIMMAARAFRSADLYAGIIVLGAVGYVANTALERVEQHLLRWKVR